MGIAESSLIVKHGEDDYRRVLEEGLMITQVPDDLKPALGTNIAPWNPGTSPPPEGGDISASRSILLIGDSHMAIWMFAFDVLGKKYNYHIHLNWVPSCPTYKYRPEYWGVRCLATIDNYVSLAQTVQPDYVFMAHMF